MIDLVLKGKICFPENNEDEILRDFDIFLAEHKAHFDGTARVYQFDNCEIVSDEEAGN